MDRQEGIEKSIELAKKALDLDPALAEAYAVMGDIDIYVDHNWEEAEKNLRQALKLNPNYATAHQYYSELLSLTGRIEQARKHMDKAIELDPFSFVIRFLSGENYYYQGQLEKVLEEFEHCNDLIKDHAWVINLEFEIYYQLGMETEALESFKRYQKHYNNFDPDLVDSVYTHEGLRGLLEVKAATDKSSSSIARGYALLGEYTRAVDTLKKAHTGNRLSYRRILFSPLGKLVGEEDFIRLLEEMDVHPAYLQ
jgi:tetratricopeptide (TPR) repeat protein